MTLSLEKLENLASQRLHDLPGEYTLIFGDSFGNAIYQKNTCPTMLCLFWGAEINFKSGNLIKLANDKEALKAYLVKMAANFEKFNTTRESFKSLRKEYRARNKK